MMAAAVPVLAVRGSTGICVNRGPPSYDLVAGFGRDDSKTCKAMCFSLDGDYFAWTNGSRITVVATSTWAVLAELARPKACDIKFTPCGTYLMSWEPFTVSNANPDGGPNLHIFKSDSGELVQALVQKKQIGWAPCWSTDESICVRLVNSNIALYSGAALDTPVERLVGQKVATFSLSAGPAPFHILCYIPGKSAQPSFGKLFQCGKLDVPVASKSFFQADRVDTFWNRKGTRVLLMTSMEVDQGSYYGKQALHYLSTRGDTSMVPLSKEGPIHSVAWSPLSSEFCVVYGFMPAKASLFNHKCEAIFDFGTGNRNDIYYNPHGNILMLGGFGNLPGAAEMWSINGASRKRLAAIEAADTTLVRWSPDGEHFATATTAPRLKVGNGFKIWHYSGALLYERPWNEQEELWEVAWQSFPAGTFRPPQSAGAKLVEGIQSSQATASKQAYRPPSARGKVINFKLHDEEDGPTDNTANPSKAALKLKKKREAKRAAKQQQAAATLNGEEGDDGEGSGGEHRSLPPPADEAVNIEDPEKLKKYKKVKAKLVEIARLSEQQKSGKQLEINQLDKIKKRDQLLKELQQLAL